MRASASSSGSARPWRGSFGGSYDRLGLALEILWHIFRAPLKRAPCPYLSTDATRLETYRIRDDALFPQDRYAEAGREFVEVLNRVAPLLADSTIILAPSIPGCRAATDRFSSAVDAAIADGFEQIPNPGRGVARGRRSAAVALLRSRQSSQCERPRALRPEDQRGHARPLTQPVRVGTLTLSRARHLLSLSPVRP